MAGSSVELKYVFYESYLDQCHPNNPSCVTGVTCTNCADGFNPTLDVACNLVVFSQNPLMTGVGNDAIASSCSIRPNPTEGITEVYVFGTPSEQAAPLQLFTMAGTMVAEYPWNGKTATLNLSGLSKGVYLLKVPEAGRTEMKKVVLQ